jgi:hypothetical protein
MSSLICAEAGAEAAASKATPMTRALYLMAILRLPNRQLMISINGDFN